MDVSEFVASLRASPEYEGQMVHVERIPARCAQCGALEVGLEPQLGRALERSGVGAFYSHQAQAINLVVRGENVIVATGTASGKSLCYNVPVLQALLKEPVCKALYLFPTKALAQDQLRALRALSADLLGPQRIAVYDGDTPLGSRGRIRQRASILLSNPDMLHASILPNHTLWGAFFRHLRYVVLDEAHTYRGVFGGHVAAVLRRLRRVCARYGSHPQFILCSATLANPQDHAERLTGLHMALVEDDGAPHGPRQFVLWNPPIEDRLHSHRRSVNTEAAHLLVDLALHGLRHIAFVRARRVAELLVLYARQSLARVHPELADRISPYRAGYLAEERRAIERRLFSGDLVGVAATNALELGIDVGHLDATLLVGYPGSIASTWQQAGRAGRGTRESLSILIAQDDPLDQYLMRHPEAIFGRLNEHALMDPGNEHILKAHLACAASELPLDAQDEGTFGEGFVRARDALTQAGTLEPKDGRWYYPAADHPARRISLRSGSGVVVLLVDETVGNRVLEEIDVETALFRIHPGAVYIHRGESFLVVRLDLQGLVAYAQPIEGDYYTQVQERNEVHIVRSLHSRSLPSTDVFFGHVRVTDEVIGFRRKQQYTDKVIAEEPLDLPPVTYETEAVWYEVPTRAQEELQVRRLDAAGGLHAVEHASIAILPLFALCDRDDLAGLSTMAHPDTSRAQVFVYDAHPGGTGIVRKGYDLVEEWWQRTLEVIRGCPCEEGCPSCIQSPKCGNNNSPLDKHAALLVLERLLA